VYDEIYKMLIKRGSRSFINILYILSYTNDLLLLMSYKFNNFNNFVILASTRLRLPEDDAYVSKHVGLLTKSYYMCVCIYIYTCVCVCVLCICWYR